MHNEFINLWMNDMNECIYDWNESIYWFNEIHEWHEWHEWMHEWMHLMPAHLHQTVNESHKIGYDLSLQRQEIGHDLSLQR